MALPLSLLALLLATTSYPSSLPPQLAGISSPLPQRVKEASTGAGTTTAAGVEWLEVSVTDFGAVGNGKQNCTAAFRAATDAVRQAGGGMVRVPAGRFLTGAFNLSSNVHLALDADAVVVGIEASSPDAAQYDYPLLALLPSHGTGLQFHSLVRAEKETNVTVSGGTFDGGGSQWWVWGDCTTPRNRTLPGCEIHRDSLNRCLCCAVTAECVCVGGYKLPFVAENCARLPCM